MSMSINRELPPGMEHQFENLRTFQTGMSWACDDDKELRENGDDKELGGSGDDKERRGNLEFNSPPEDLVGDNYIGSSGICPGDIAWEVARDQEQRENERWNKKRQEQQLLELSKEQQGTQTTESDVKANADPQGLGKFRFPAILSRPNRKVCIVWCAMLSVLAAVVTLVVITAVMVMVPDKTTAPTTAPTAAPTTAPTSAPTTAPTTAPTPTAAPTQPVSYQHTLFDSDSTVSSFVQMVGEVHEAFLTWSYDASTGRLVFEAIPLAQADVVEYWSITLASVEGQTATVIVNLRSVFQTTSIAQNISADQKCQHTWKYNVTLDRVDDDDLVYEKKLYCHWGTAGRRAYSPGSRLDTLPTTRSPTTAPTPVPTESYNYSFTQRSGDLAITTDLVERVGVPHGEWGTTFAFNASQVREYWNTTLVSVKGQNATVEVSVRIAHNMSADQNCERTWIYSVTLNADNLTSPSDPLSCNFGTAGNRTYIPGAKVALYVCTSPRCGFVWLDANDKCGTPCTVATATQCPAGEGCYADVSTTLDCCG